MFLFHPSGLDKTVSRCSVPSSFDFRGSPMEGLLQGDGVGGGKEQEQQHKMGEVQALLFARAHELAGVSEVTIEIHEGWTTAHCFDAVMAKFPALKSISTCIMVSLNHNFITEPVLVNDGDELALIPPISGG